MWQFPWKYRESIAFTGGMLAVGIALQYTVGAFDFGILRWPVNLILGDVLLAALLLMSIWRKSSFYQWLSGVPMAVTLIGTLVVLGIIMGLTPQLSSPSHSLPDRLGLTHMTSSWPFVLTYSLTLLSLGALIIRRLIAFRWRDYAFYLNHIGLWLLLFAGGMSASDIKRYVMYVREGETEWRVYNDQKEVLDLPIAIELIDFSMDEYPPKLAIIDRETGTTQPEAQAEYFQIDEQVREGRLCNWQIVLKQYIHQAVRNSDSTYHEVRMPGASPAALVEVYRPETGERKEGWICAGNLSQLYMTLNLNEEFCVAMTRPEPKRFVSDIHIYTEDGHQAHTLLEVNKPYKLGHWMVYQYGYDSEAGTLSSYSSFELVYDPWVTPVYAGVILLALGSVCMLWGGNRRNQLTIDSGQLTIKN